MKTYEVCVDDDGSRVWRLNGKRHREDGPAVEHTDGYRAWWLNGDRHREDGPAIERANGDRFWYRNGKLHREDGPAVEWADGCPDAWYLNGKCVSEEEHRAATDPVKEMTVAEIESALGHRVKVVK